MLAMKRFLVLLSCATALACAAEISDVKTVYVFPMSRGLDQYLINRLTNEHLFQVVTDPKMADAAFTERVGEGLRSQLDDVAPLPAPEKPAKEEADKDKDKDKGDQPPKLITDTVNKLDNPGAQSTFGRGKGTIFLVDFKSRAVLWSTYDQPKGVSSQELDRTATGIVSRLKRDLTPKKK